MKLSISNIGWSAEQDEVVYDIIAQNGFHGLEIAPTRIFPENPYDKLKEARLWYDILQEKYGFEIPSMQSIWFGRNEKLFASAGERDVLLEYTKKAILFAEAIGCRNLVFGCPRNRIMTEGADEEIAIEFFHTIGEYALKHNTVIGMEANPPIYNTNYINTTMDALKLIDCVDSKGFLLNLDIGTMIENEESVLVLRDNIPKINHVHISEPGLKPVVKRTIHGEIIDLLKENNYSGYVSIEMGNHNDINIVQSTICYVKGLVF